MIAKQSKSDRKSRTKPRKPKFLSLRLQLNATPPPPPPLPVPVPPMSPTTTTTDHRVTKQQLINLFPLHPEKLADDEHNMAACIFSSCDDVDRAATTLTGILRSDDDEDDEENRNENGNGNGNRNTDNPSPSSVNYADEEVELVRTAMRRNVSDKTDDEKWVCYSEVVERKKEIISSSSSSTTTTTSNWCSNVNVNGNGNHRHRSKLVLKLDYDKVMECWVNKGPLYIHGDVSGNGNGNSDAPQPQTVPDLHDDHDFFWGTRHDEQDNGGNAGSWTVPEMTQVESSGMSRGDDALQAGESMMHNREASVQRYKEKRRNRLFAKTIRYEVRKLNAEKRPRIKGRFVKRN